VQLLELPPQRLAGDLRLDLNRPCEPVHLGFELCLGCVAVDLGNGLSCLLDLAVSDELAGRLGAHGQQAGENDGGDATNGNHPSPTVSGISQGSAQSVGDELAKRDAHVVKCNHAASILGGGELSDVEGLNGSVLLELGSLTTAFRGSTHNYHSS
jgi:hypothetical protein